MSYFCLQTRAYGNERNRKEKKRKKGEIKPRYGYMTLVWIDRVFFGDYFGSFF